MIITISNGGGEQRENSFMEKSAPLSERRKAKRIILPLTLPVTVEVYAKNLKAVKCVPGSFRRDLINFFGI